MLLMGSGVGGSGVNGDNGIVKPNGRRVVGVEGSSCTVGIEGWALSSQVVVSRLFVGVSWLAFLPAWSFREIGNGWGIPGNGARIGPFVCTSGPISAVIVSNLAT